MAEPLPLAEAVTIRAGDILVVRVDLAQATHPILEHLTEALREQLPPDVRVLVVAADQIAVIRG